jgi:hypothetical protein
LVVVTELLLGIAIGAGMVCRLLVLRSVVVVRVLGSDEQADTSATAPSIANPVSRRRAVVVMDLVMK